MTLSSPVSTFVYRAFLLRLWLGLQGWTSQDVWVWSRWNRSGLIFQRSGLEWSTAERTRGAVERVVAGHQQSAFLFLYGYFAANRTLLNSGYRLSPQGNCPIMKPLIDSVHELAFLCAPSSRTVPSKGQ
jgi:hypothetical protein